MIVDEHDGGRAASNRIPEDLARMNETRGERSDRDGFDRHQAVAPVEQEHLKRLPPERSQRTAEMPLDIGRTANRRAPFQRFVEDAPGEFDGGAKARRFRRTESGNRLQGGTRRGGEAREPAEPVEDAAGDRRCVTDPIAGSQNEGEQFGIGQRADALRLQAVTRSVHATAASSSDG